MESSYLIYAGVAALTIALPGPAVMLSINNSLQRGLPKALAGIVGIATGILVVAILSATGLGAVLASSATALSVIKLIGAAYLIYLGIKMWRRTPLACTAAGSPAATYRKCLLEGFLLSVSNPKAIVFFMAIFPQFIDASEKYTPQFLLLSVIFSGTVIIIHTLYASLASLAKAAFTTPKANSLLSKISGGVFIGFGVGLAVSNR